MIRRPHTSTLTHSHTLTHAHTHTHTHTHTLLTCTDSHCFHKLLPPGVGADHQRQIGLLNELVHGALPITNTEGTVSSQSEDRMGDKALRRDQGTPWAEYWQAQHRCCTWTSQHTHTHLTHTHTPYTHSHTPYTHSHTPYPHTHLTHTHKARQL